jgi:hypothetical protein
LNVVNAHIHAYLVFIRNGVLPSVRTSHHTTLAAND